MKKRTFFSSIWQKGFCSIESLLLLTVVIIGAFLRFDTLSTVSLGNDELSALMRTDFDSFSEMIEKGVRPDGHPALVQSFLYFYTGMVGVSSDLLLRLPFAIAGVLAIYYMFRLGRSYGGSLTGLLSAAFLAVAAFPILYSRLARPYSFGLLFILMFAFYWSCFLNAEDRREELRWIPLFILSGALCMFTHYFCGLTALILGFIGLFKLRKGALRNYLLSGFGVFLLFSPHLGISYGDISKGGIGGPDGWLGEPDLSFFGDHLLYIFNGSPWVLGGVLFLILSGILLQGRSDRSPWHLLLVFILPLGVGYCYSLWIEPVLQHSILLFSMPFLVIFLFSWIGDQRKAFPRVFLVAILTIGIGVHTVKGVWYYETATNGNFKRLAEIYKKWHREYGEEKITRAASFNNGAYLEHYLRVKGDALSAPELSTIRSKKDFQDLKTLIDSASTPYFLFAWAATENRAYYRESIREKYPHAVADRKFFNSGITLFSKKGSDEREGSAIWKEDFDDDPLPYTVQKNVRDSSFHRSPPASCLISSDRLYGPTLEVGLEEGTDRSSSILVKGSAWILREENAKKPYLVLTYEANDSTYLWRKKPMLLFHGKENGRWKRSFTVGVIRGEMPRNGTLKCYFWNPDKLRFRVDDMKLELMPWWDMNVVQEYLEYERSRKKR